MNDDPARIENQPYFKWRRDGAIQTTLGLAAGSIALTFAGFDTLSIFGGHLAHLFILSTAGLLGGSVILQFRFSVIALREICTGIVMLALAGIFLHPSPLGMAALAAALLLGVAALVRMRSPHWSAFRAYCRFPEVIPRATKRK